MSTLTWGIFPRRTWCTRIFRCKLHTRFGWIWASSASEFWMTDFVPFLRILIFWNAGTGSYLCAKVSETWLKILLAGKPALSKWPVNQFWMFSTALQFDWICSNSGLNTQLVKWDDRTTEVYAFNKSLMLDSRGKPLSPTRCPVLKWKVLLVARIHHAFFYSCSGMTSSSPKNWRKLGKCGLAKVCINSNLS